MRQPSALCPAKRNPFAWANTNVDASATPGNENRPSASEVVSVRAGASPDWKTVAPATGFPFASTTRPASVRVFGGFCSVIVTSVSRPASIDLLWGVLNFSVELSGTLTVMYRVPTESSGTSNRPDASGTASVLPLDPSGPPAVETVNRRSLSPWSALGSSTTIRPAKRPTGATRSTNSPSEPEVVDAS